MHLSVSGKEEGREGQGWREGRGEGGGVRGREGGSREAISQWNWPKYIVQVMNIEARD